MKIRHSKSRTKIPPEIVLFLAGILVFAATAVILRVPGYMDAEYYYMNGQRLASGEGFREMVIWNYLDNPQELPHPSHTYWMPLTSLTAALGMFLLKKQQFFCAQVPFILIAGMIPLIMYRIGRILYEDPKKALLAAILSLFSGYYLAYQGTTSTIGLFMLEGGLFFWLLLSINQNKPYGFAAAGRFAGLGFIAGLMHLTRSDGILWLAGAMAFVILFIRGRKQSGNQPDPSALQMAMPVLWVIFGYLIISGFWFAHNLVNFGRLLPPGGILTVWLKNYNQMFSFTTESIGFTEWFRSGIGEILTERLRSTWDNLMTLLAVEGEIILLPMLIAGLMKHRRQIETRILVLIWILTFLLMSWVFPFAGSRGGFFHSSAAFQPFIWAMIPAGFDQFIRWGVGKRNWNEERAFKNFGILLCGVLAVFTATIYYGKVIGTDPNAPAWQKEWKDYSQVEQAVSKIIPDRNAVIIVKNPPGYYLASGGRPAIVIPDGDDEMLKLAADKFNAQAVAIDRDIVDELNHLYTHPASSDWLEYLFTEGDTRIYRVRRENEKR